MSGPGNPWADPSTPTEPGAPYAGPPPTAPGAPYGPYQAPPGYGHPPYGYPHPYAHPGPYGGPPSWGALPWGGLPWGAPPWGAPPGRPRRPGQVISSAVLAFVQAGLVLFASLYVYFFASIADLAVQQTGEGYATSTAVALANEGTVLAAVQLVSVVLLVGGGIVALARRSRGAWLLLVAAHLVQILLAIYWAVRLLDVLGSIPGPGSEEAFAAFTLFFAAAPLAGLLLVVGGAGRRWFSGGPPV